MQRYQLRYTPAARDDDRGRGFLNRARARAPVYYTQQLNETSHAPIGGRMRGAAACRQPAESSDDWCGKKRRRYERRDTAVKTVDIRADAIFKPFPNDLYETRGRGGGAR